MRTRLHQNAEVIGTDEAFFEDEDQQTVLDLYNENGILDDDSETDVDLSSYAYQIWRNATDNDANAQAKDRKPAANSVGFPRKPIPHALSALMERWSICELRRGMMRWPGLTVRGIT